MCLCTGALAIRGVFGRSTLPRAMSSIQCNGNESSLVECQYQESDYCRYYYYDYWNSPSVFCQGEFHKLHHMHGLKYKKFKNIKNVKG